MNRQLPMCFVCNAKLSVELWPQKYLKLISAFGTMGTCPRCGRRNVMIVTYEEIDNEVKEE